VKHLQITLHCHPIFCFICMLWLGNDIPDDGQNRLNLMSMHVGVGVVPGG